VVVERPDHLERRERAERAVEAPAGGLRVQVTADQHPRSVGVGAGALGEQVAELVADDRAAGRARPALEAVERRAVLVGEREPAAAAVARVADPGQLHQAAPEPVPVDPGRGGHWDPAGRGISKLHISTRTSASRAMVRSSVSDPRSASARRGSPIAPVADSSSVCHANATGPKGDRC
jgi:hypothetical protein